MKVHTVKSIVIKAPGTLVTSRGLEFASQLWLLSLIDRQIDVRDNTR